jgi:tetratricopeptide (TPR) repeat protein
MVIQKRIIQVDRGGKMSESLNDIVIAKINIIRQTIVLFFMPKDGDANFEKGCSLAFLKKYKSAIKYLSIAVEKGIEDDSLYYRRGICYEETNMIDLAINDYSKAIAINPNNADAYYNRGNLYLNTSDIIQAKRDYEKNIEIEPTAPKPYIALAYLLFKEQELNAAIYYYKKGVKLEPSYTEYIPEELLAQVVQK